MLADEISITTRVTDEENRPADTALRVEIASSGSLFRIVPAGGFLNGGTEVKLYLSDDSAVSCLNTMRNVLWCAEFDTEVTEQDVTERWEHGQLKPTDTLASHSVEPDVWWLNGRGGLIADGIRTEQRRYGYVVNLRGRHQPQFTVDRNRLRWWDKGWVDERLDLAIDRLSGWRHLSLPWLWALSKDNPRLAGQIVEHLASQAIPIRITSRSVRANAVDLAAIGCFWPDDRLVHRRSTMSAGSRHGGCECGAASCCPSTMNSICYPIQSPDIQRWNRPTEIFCFPSTRRERKRTLSL
jgi:hypothetical protein